MKQTVKTCRQHTDILKKENFYGLESKEVFSVERDIKFSLSMDKIMHFFQNHRLISVLQKKNHNTVLCQDCYDVMIVRWAHFQHIIFQHEGYWCERVYFNPNHNDFLNRPDSF